MAELPTNIRNALAKAGFDTVEKLESSSAEEIRKLPGIGHYSFNRIKDFLRQHAKRR